MWGGLTVAGRTRIAAPIGAKVDHGGVVVTVTVKEAMELDVTM